MTNLVCLETEILSIKEFYFVSKCLSPLFMASSSKFLFFTKIKKMTYKLKVLGFEL